LTSSKSGKSEEEFPTSSESSPIVSLDEFVQTQSKSGTRIFEKNATQKKSDKTIAASGIEETQVNVEVQRERARTRLSLGLLGLLTASLVGTGVYIFVDLLVPRNVSEQRSNTHRELITIIWTSQVTLVGSALGFYFGSERDSSNNSKK
jgi:hypothetical protein